ncbi:MAG: ATP-dependent helicase RecQ, partial [Chloroflexota bacterium]|nr:ATP-dependent helicase RecQ [Chloroflexota bacterium]
HDSVLRSMAARLPGSEEALLRIGGVGQQKAAAYGEAFLACIAEFVAETGAQPADEPPPALRRARAAAGASALTTLALFNEGRSLAEVAAARQLALRTVEDHLAEALEAGGHVDLDRLVDSERRAAIERAIGELGEASLLRTIMDRLGDGYTFGEIKLVRAALSRSQPTESRDLAAAE